MSSDYPSLVRCYGPEWLGSWSQRTAEARTRRGQTTSHQSAHSEKKASASVTFVFSFSLSDSKQSLASSKSMIEQVKFDLQFKLSRKSAYYWKIKPLVFVTLYDVKCQTAWAAQNRIWAQAQCSQMTQSTSATSECLWTASGSVSRWAKHKHSCTGTSRSRESCPREKVKKVGFLPAEDMRLISYLLSCLNLNIWRIPPHIESQEEWI